MYYQMKTVTLITLLLAIIVSTLSYKIHQSFYHHRHQHHKYIDKIHYIPTMVYLAKADDIFERRNKTEIFNLAFSDDESLDECSLDGECSDTPKAWTGQRENSNNSISSKSNDKNEKTPIWLSDDDNDKNEHTPKGKLYPR